MAQNSLLEEFASSNQGNIYRRLTDRFDKHLSKTDEDATSRLKTELEVILQERIDALSQN